MPRIPIGSLAIVLLTTGMSGPAQAQYDKGLSAFYEIVEGTRDERVAVGSNGNILRWSVTNGDEQLWLLTPLGGGKYHIRTKANREYMAVGSNGNILRWSATDGDEQKFRLVPKHNGRYQIKEFTKKECVAVGSNGNILRWACNAGKEQEFRLVPHPIGSLPKVRPAEVEPGQIGDIPRVEGFGKAPPEHSDPKLVGEVVIPAVYVHEPDLDAFDQVQSTPYYILKREQFWDRRSGRGAYVEHDGKVARTHNTTITLGMKKSASESFEETLGITVSAGAGFAYGGASADVRTEITKTLKTDRTSSEEQTNENVTTNEEVFPEGPPFVRVVWSLIDRFTLLNVNREPLESLPPWEIVSNTTKKDRFPRTD